MSGRPKQGIDYSGWSVNIFDGDRKIDKLLDAQGWKGFGVYFFLCQSAYKLNGYYLEWCYDDCATTARRMGGFMGAETVKTAVDLCLQVGLFDQKLFDGWGVLTSKGIQRRYWAAISASGRRAVPLYKDIWLLPPEEVEGLDKVARFDYLLPANADLLPANADLLPANADKVNKSKVNEKKVKESKEKAALPPPPFAGPLQSAVCDWLEYHKEIKKPYNTERGLKILYGRIQENANKFGEAAVIDCINESISNGWQGLFFDRLKKAFPGQIPQGDARYGRAPGTYSGGDFLDGWTSDTGDVKP